MVILLLGPSHLSRVKLRKAFVKRALENLNVPIELQRRVFSWDPRFGDEAPPMMTSLNIEIIGGNQSLLVGYNLDIWGGKDRGLIW